MNFIDKMGFKLTRSLMKKRNVTDTESVYRLKKNCYNRIPVKGCVTSNGLQQKLYVWDGSEDDLMISFYGGGVTMKMEDCAYPMRFSALAKKEPMLYAPDAEELFQFASFAVPKDSGIVSEKAHNPFARWTKVMIPYVSGDFHVGTADQEYTDKEGKKQVMHLHGYTNFQQIISVIKERWPSPKRLLITGSSAGSFGASALASKIIDLYADCPNITVYCDSSYIPMDNWQQITAEFWQAPEEIVKVIHTDDLGGDWLEDLYRKHGDKVKIIYSCSTEDSILSTVTSYEHGGKYEASEEYRKIIKEGYKQRIRRFAENGIDIKNFVFALPDKVNGGTLHTISQDKRWHDHKVDGVSTAQWVMDAVEGNCYDVGLSLLD